ncbi:tetratricopeptide repeat protein [Alteromonas sp. ASW11-36]|uniref:Tetratricopeptide repeat protein n=1 Tax=Alteromonas arenosi TaxID=3055817 RepID=A0ABT7SUE1_9ALTE|nr:tetratricopeptide repeat protein [Alteromonas sp. ASW11-36]MDM7859808.1 tetratricopeptide repeat protein [Alteromonas sp. ASW11-36]
MFPVFRDEEALPADADLSNVITRALDNTQFLIVLCSPRARESSFVADEILYFKRLGNSDRIIAGIIDGEPNTSLEEGKIKEGFSTKDECFPEPLQFIYDDNGEQTSQRTEPVAADFRVVINGRKTQGWTSPQALQQHLIEETTLSKEKVTRIVKDYDNQLQLMLLKVIAGIIGVPLDDLTQRDKAYQLALEKQKAKQLRRWLVGVTLLAAISVGTGTYAFKQQRIAEAQRDRAEGLLDNVRENLNFMNFDLRDVMLKYAPSNERVRVMQRIDALLEALSTHNDSQSENDLRAELIVLSQKADVILSSAAENPEEALPLYEQSLVIAQQLIALDPKNSLYKQDLSVSYQRVGNIQLRIGDTDAALEAYQQALTIDKQLVAQYPLNAGVQRDLSISYNKIGNIQLQLGNTEAALESYQQALTIREQLVALHPQDAEFQRDLSGSYNNLGNIQLRIGNTDAALEAYQQALTISKQLVALDPQNADFQRDLSILYNNLGDIQLQLGNTNAALEAYQQALTIREQLVAQDPQNAGFQHDLSVSYNNLGDIQLQLGNTEAALESYQQALTIREQLVALDPQDAGFQRGLLVSFWNLARALDEQGKGAEAKLFWQKCLNQLLAMQSNGTLLPDDVQFIEVVNQKLTQ